MAVPREKVRDFLLGKIDAKDMPNGFNVAHEFDVDIRISNGNRIKLISGLNELLIEGDAGRLRVNRGADVLGRLTGKIVEQIDADPKARQEIEQLMVEIYGGPLPTHRRGHFQNFFDCVRSGKLPVANVPEHVRAVNACHMANLSLVLGRKVRWDTRQQQFLDDAEANALTRRKQRAEYKIEV
jgi:hypothetical protein